MKALQTNYRLFAIIRKIIFSMIISAFMITTNNLIKNDFQLFIVFTVIVYLSTEAVLRIFNTSVSSFYDALTRDLFKIQQQYSESDLLETSKKDVLAIKFRHVRDTFIKQVLTQQFLRTNSYNPDNEEKDFNLIAKNTIDLYTEEMRRNGVSQNFIDQFHLTHREPTQEFVTKITYSMHHERQLWERRRVFRYALVGLMKSSVNDFLAVKVTMKEKKSIDDKLKDLKTISS